jgi:hypothetical protein
MARSREAMRELKDILKAREPFYRQSHAQSVGAMNLPVSNLIGSH